MARGDSFDLWPLECRFPGASCRPVNLLAFRAMANRVALSVGFVRFARFHNQASRYFVACFGPRGKCDRKSCRRAPLGPYRGAVVSASQRSPLGNTPQGLDWKGASRVVRAGRAGSLDPTPYPATPHRKLRSGAQSFAWNRMLRLLWVKSLSLPRAAGCVGRNRPASANFVFRTRRRHAGDTGGDFQSA